MNYKYPLYLLIILLLSCCTHMNKNGETTTPEGTTVTNNVNSDMETHRTAADVDSVRSPGSNSQNIEKGHYSQRDEQKQISSDNAGYHKGNDKTK